MDKLTIALIDSLETDIKKTKELIQRLEYNLSNLKHNLENSVSLPSLPSRYVEEIDNFDFQCLFTIKDWKELKFDSYDGIGFWVKDNFKSEDSVFSTPALDATHVVWYNN